MDGEQTVCMETRGPNSDVLIHDLQETLVRLIYERWPGSLQDEEQPFAFTVPCPTAGCNGRYELTVLQSERDAKREDAPCNKRPPHRHPIAKLLYGIELPSSGAEGRKVMLDSRTHGQPPRLLEVSEPSERDAGKRLTKNCVRIELYCELSEKLVPGAAATIEVDKDWVEAVKRWLPWVEGQFKMLYKTISTPDADLDFKGLPKPADQKNAAGNQALSLPKGRLLRPEGQILPSAMADKLIEIAYRGGMLQT